MLWLHRCAAPVPLIDVFNVEPFIELASLVVLLVLYGMRIIAVGKAPGVEGGRGLPNVGPAMALFPLVGAYEGPVARGA